MDGHKTARYRKISGYHGFRYQFFCDLSGALMCTTDFQKEDDPLQAWATKGRKLFSRCQKCGRWVSDPMYNAETLECVRCSPWEEQPAFCPQCGESVLEDRAFCHRCHARLKYRDKEECG
ncbi:MAG: hypothetical protein IJE08_00485 [Clostridia bacterium]|nr:hypothetical protein [Clostridia bacterium]